MKILPDGSLNFYTSLNQLVLAGFAPVLGIAAGLVIYFSAGDIIGLLLTVAAGVFLFFVLKTAFAGKPLVTLKDSDQAGAVIVLKGCAPLFLEDVIKAQAKTVKASNFIIFDVPEDKMPKYKVTAIQKINFKMGLGYFCTDVNMLSKKDKAVLRAELSKHFDTPEF